MVGVPLIVGVRVTVGVGVMVGVEVTVPVGVKVRVIVGVRVPVGVKVSVGVCVGVGVEVSVGVGVTVGVFVTVDVGDCVGVLVGVRVEVLVKVLVGVDVTVAVGSATTMTLSRTVADSSGWSFPDATAVKSIMTLRFTWFAAGVKVKVASMLPMALVVGKVALAGSVLAESTTCRGGSVVAVTLSSRVCPGEIVHVIVLAIWLHEAPAGAVASCESTSWAHAPGASNTTISSPNPDARLAWRASRRSVMSVHSSAGEAGAYR